MISVGPLRDILELECKKGYADKAVIGGLDKYLHKQAGRIRELVANPQLLRSFDELNLANSSYASWDIDKRRKWIKSVFYWLDKLGKAKEGKSGIGVASGSVAMAKLPSQKRSETLTSPITAIRGITPNIAAKFSKLNVRTVHDLLYFFPRRYLDYSQRKFIAELEEGEEQTIVAIIWEARVATFGKRQRTQFTH